MSEIEAELNCCNRRTVENSVLSAREVGVWHGKIPLVRRASFEVGAGEIFGIIGPSGAGKSSLLRALNRLNELIPGLRVTGEVALRGSSIYSPDADPDEIRARIGMLFQQPVVFPGSIRDNTLFGARHLRRMNRGEKETLVEECLREVALWEEVKDRLKAPAVSLSVGQQQRLCLARSLAVRPEVILMDEPTSALDPRSAGAIEELMLRLKERLSIVLVTHNVEQARRVTDWLACLCLRDGAGEIVESACCDALLSNPTCREAVEFLSGKGSQTT